MNRGEGSETSATLLGRLRQRPADDAAWCEFTVRYARKIYGWCRGWNLQEADAHDERDRVRERRAFERPHDLVALPLPARQPAERGRDVGIGEGRGASHRLH